jgi:hypothetical protein
MKKSLTLFLTLAAMTVAIVVSSKPSYARGGAASIMNSPGYQRRLQESRQQSSQPGLQPSSVHRHKARHRRRH